MPRPTHRYVPMAKGFVYVVAIMDWYSRKVLAWRVSNTLDADFCVDALEEAISRYGAPDIFNTDQGSPVYQCLHRCSQGGGYPDQHGRQGSLGGQCVCGALVAQPEIRGGVRRYYHI